MTTPITLAPAPLIKAVALAGQRVPPLWPLATSVAVNPFLGETGSTLAATSAHLARMTGADALMPASWYKAQWENGRLTDADIEAALKACPHPQKPESAAALKTALDALQDGSVVPQLPTIACLAAKKTGTDWPAIVEDVFGRWAASWFDAGQALWSIDPAQGAWASWRSWAMHDLSPEIHGLKGFAAFVAQSPVTPSVAIARFAETLKLPDDACETYFTRLLFSLGGWAQHARYRLWEAELRGTSDETLSELLAIRLAFEAALLPLAGGPNTAGWHDTLEACSQPMHPSADLVIREIMQEAIERAGQRTLAAKLGAPASGKAETNKRPSVQAAFCIDVRSEVFRRALEKTDQTIATMGFAGFFGIASGHKSFASDTDEKRLPVLLNPGVFTCEPVTGENAEATEKNARYRHRARRAFGRFRLAAVSSFAFVEAMGPAYALRLVKGALGLAGDRTKAAPKPAFATGMSLETRIATAAKILNAMGLTDNFAPIVLLAGHGATATNNPQESALHCGACGGHAGDVNARLLASLLNDASVRSGLKAEGIIIPEDTLFLAGLHNTTTDKVTLFSGDAPSPAHTKAIADLETALETAGKLCRSERIARLPGAANESAIMARAKDWAETRPEWALAGCQAFIAAPRTFTAGSDLGGSTFLHDYDWKADAKNGYGVLELILTAPVVVASWISLQYYGSTVAPDVFGAGNKLLHNVTGGIGVVEGNGGNLRGGLSWQSVHDGEKLIHDPLRLTVYCAAPEEAILPILERNPSVRALFDNRWLHLITLDDQGQARARYNGDLTFEQVDGLNGLRAEAA